MPKNMMVYMPRLTELDIIHIYIALRNSGGKYKDIKRYQLMLVPHKTIVSALTVLDKRGWWAAPGILKKLANDK